MKKTKLLFAIIFLSACCSAQAQAPLSTKAIFSSMQKVANWQLNVLDTGHWKYPATDWTNAAYYTGQMAWAKMANDYRQLQFLLEVGKKNNWKGGPERFFADDYCVGQTYAQLYMLYEDPVMIEEMKKIGDEIIAQPHTESLLWNFEGGLHNREWAWCDALYMGPPMLAYLYTATGQQKYLDVANKLWWRTTEYLYDKEEHLFYRDSRFFEKREKNGRKVFWSRGNGWVIAGLTRMLDNMPQNYPDRPRYIELYKQMASRIAGLIQPDGTWHASLLDPKSYPVKETSGTGFFAYALTWGINQGILPYNQYFPVVQKAWEALNNCVHPNGKLGFVQVPGAAPETVDYNDTETYGVGAYLLAGTELFKLMFNKEAAPAKITAVNPVAVNRQLEMIETKWEPFFNARFSPDKVTVISAQTGDTIPAQVVYAGRKLPQSLIFPSGITAGSSGYFYVIKQQGPAVAAKTYGRLVPERMDDFAWENDQIAFRMYGPALQASGEISSGIDIWGKKTSRLIINDWYKQNDYHKDHGEGMDFYGVGTTLGAGGTAPFINDKLYPSQNYVEYKVLDNGPLRTTFQLTYKPWQAAGKTVAEVKTITLDAGTFLNKIEENYTYSGSSLPVAIGIATLPGAYEEWHKIFPGNSLMAYQQNGPYGSLNIGVVLPDSAAFAKVAATDKDHYNHTGHVMLVAQHQQNKPLIYYQGAAWNQQGTIKNFAQWQQYLSAKALAIQNPLILLIQTQKTGANP